MIQAAPDAARFDRAVRARDSTRTSDCRRRGSGPGIAQAREVRGGFCRTSASTPSSAASESGATVADGPGSGMLNPTCASAATPQHGAQALHPDWVKVPWWLAVSPASAAPESWCVCAAPSPWSCAWSARPLVGALAWPLHRCMPTEARPWSGTARASRQASSRRKSAPRMAANVAQSSHGRASEQDGLSGTGEARPSRCSRRPRSSPLQRFYLRGNPGHCE